jgi:hypothetical protein
MGHHDKPLEFLGFFFPGVVFFSQGTVSFGQHGACNDMVLGLLADEFDGKVVVGY